MLSRQLDETRARQDVGQLTRTDVAQSQASAAQDRAQFFATAQAALANARAAYNAVVGQYPGELAAEPPIASLLPASVDAAFDAAEQNSPQLAQARDAEIASAARLAEAKAQALPSVSLQGSYAFTGGSTTIQGLFAIFSTRGGPFSNYTHDATISATITAPISTGGLTSSEIRQAAELDNANRVGVDAARRQMLQAVATAWNQLLGARANLAADAEAVKADSVAFDGVRAEARLGLRTVLDVLNAQQELASSQLSLVSARHDEYVAEAAVLAATGVLSARTLIPTQPLYDPKANFDRVRHAPGWTPWEPMLEVIDQLGAPRAPLP